jgi:HEAT repeat protein
MTRENLVSWLAVDEPRYHALAAGLSPDDAHTLVELVASDDLNLASKAASLAGFLEAGDARPVIEAGSSHPNPVVRVAAAGALRGQPELSAEFAPVLLADPDVGVRKWALKSLAATRPPGVRTLLQDHAASESVTSLQLIARDLADELP